MGSPGTGEEDETSLAGLAGGLCRLTFFRTPDNEQQLENTKNTKDLNPCLA